MDQAFTDAKQYGWSKNPIVEMLIPSTVDSTLAPEGKHVASLFCQQFAPTLPDNRSCLLYTSPSPRDVCSSRMPSSA